MNDVRTPTTMSDEEPVLGTFSDQSGISSDEHMPVASGTTTLGNVVVASRHIRGQHKEEDGLVRETGVTDEGEAMKYIRRERSSSPPVWLYSMAGVAVAVSVGLACRALKKLSSRKISKGKGKHNNVPDALICRKVLDLQHPSVPDSVVLSKDNANGINRFSHQYRFVVSDRINVCDFKECTVSAPVVDVLIQRGSICAGVVPSSFDMDWIRKYLKQVGETTWHGLGDVGVGASVNIGMCDFALGVDEIGTTISSVISSGIFGYRPTSGLVISEGFLDSSPTLSALCLAAKSGDILTQCSKALGIPKTHFQDTIERYLVASDLFSICADDMKDMLPSVIEAVKRWAGPDQAQSLSLCQWMYHRIPSIKIFMQSCGTVDFSDDETVPSTASIMDALASAAVTIWQKEKGSKSPFSDYSTSGNYSEAIKVAEDLSIAYRKAMEEGLVFVIPACTSAAPVLPASDDTIISWERDCMRFACISSLSGIPSVVIPVGAGGKNGSRNMGVSILARQRKDYTLLRSAAKLCSFISDCKATELKIPKDKSVVRQDDMTLAEKEKNEGNKCFMAKKYLQAAQHYSNALKLDPQNPVYFSNRAMSFLKLGNYVSAEDDCSSALKLDPCLVKALLRRGAARVALAQFQEAKADFERVLILEPQNKQARVELQNVMSLS